MASYSTCLQHDAKQKTQTAASTNHNPTLKSYHVTMGDHGGTLDFCHGPDDLQG